MALEPFLLPMYPVTTSQPEKGLVFQEPTHIKAGNIR
jgi:hypothetical protein